jgi:hypothetical protein
LDLLLFQSFAVFSPFMSFFLRGFKLRVDLLTRLITTRIVDDYLAHESTASAHCPSKLISRVTRAQQPERDFGVRQSLT